jgi:hypothetical protein
VEPEHLRFGGGATHTVLHPLVLVALLVAIAVIFVRPRKYGIVPFLLIAVLVPFGQVVVLHRLHFTVYRILVLVGLIRLAASRSPSARGRLAGGFNSIDLVFAGWALLALTTFSLQWMKAQALIKSLGSLLDALGGYFVLRFLIQDREDVRQAMKAFAIIAVLLAACMINEQLTHKNIFGLLGGLPTVAVAVRYGRVRSMGAFQDYITAGVFGATLLPLFAWFWSDAKSRIVGSLGMVGATAMTVTSHSTTPLLAYLAGIAGLCFWPLRKHLGAFCWGLVLAAVGLQLVMARPLWTLIELVDLTGASASHHRFMLVDNFVRHFGDWWLLGSKNYDQWGWHMWDIANQYVACAWTGGLATLLLFVAIIWMSFARLGKARKLVEHNRSEAWFLWCLGAALFSHVVAFFGVMYFDQIQVSWYALLAIISTATFEALQQPAQLEGADAFEHVNKEAYGACGGPYAK